MTEMTSVTAMSERIGALNQKIEAAHNRQDKMEVEIKALLRELSLEMKILQKDLTNDIKSIQVEFRNDMKEVHAYVNRSKGWAAAAVLLATLVGGIITKLLLSR